MPIIRSRDFIMQALPGEPRMTTLCIGILQRVDTSQPEMQALILTHTSESARKFSEVIGALGKVMKVNTFLCVAETNDPEITENCLDHPAHIFIGTVGPTLDVIHRKQLNNSLMQVYCIDNGDKLFPTFPPTETEGEDAPWDSHIMEIHDWLPEKTQTVFALCNITSGTTEVVGRIMHDPITVVVQVDESHTEIESELKKE